jgi:hypothetical protein
VAFGVQPNKPLKLTPLRGEQDQAFFGNWKQANVFPVYSGGAA